MKISTKLRTISVAYLGALLIGSAATVLAADKLDIGKSEYDSACAVCHGPAVGGMNTEREAQIMSERDLQQEINRINGALEVLGLLRERLRLQHDDLGAESGQEAMDEMLTKVAAMHLEYPTGGYSPAPQELHVFPDRC